MGVRHILLAAGLVALPVGPSIAQATPLKVLRVAPSADLTQLAPGFASIVITRIYGLMAGLTHEQPRVELPEAIQPECIYLRAAPRIFQQSWCALR